jgi:RNA polymerase sigma-70 factor, ECF subfamily
MDVSDEKLLVRRFLRESDEQSFLALYREFTPRLYSFAVHLLAGSRSDAEDVIQDVWIRAVRKLPEFRWESKFHTWLVSILIRCCSEKKRTGDRRIVMINQDSPASASPHGEDLRLQLQAAIDLLPDGQRKVFLLHDVEGYTHKEIASLLKIQAGTSKSQLFHARESLRCYLQDARR